MPPAHPGGPRQHRCGGRQLRRPRRKETSSSQSDEGNLRGIQMKVFIDPPNSMVLFDLVERFGHEPLSSMAV
ncbi:DUF2112 family protein, partial [Salmonella enterica]|uniref:DUF2112 family protein n=1 Tax=Salmonella enterica TaxID=28901 RepID=UPI003CE75857